MLSHRRKTARNARRERTRLPAPMRPSARAEHFSAHSRVPAMPTSDLHPLTDREQNQRLHDYEQGVKSAFDAIVPTLKRIAALQQGDHF